MVYNITKEPNGVKIIAHGIKDNKTAKDAIKKGVDFVEIDVSKRIFFSKFTAQHIGPFGLAGLGPILERLLTTEIKTRAFLDLKPVSYRVSFAYRLSELLLKLKLDDAKLCGHNWETISELAYKNNAKPYYTLKNMESVYKFRRVLHKLKKPAGFSVHHSLINEEFMNEFKKKSTEIWTYTIDDLTEAKRVLALEVDGIITNNWKKLLSLKHPH